MLWCHLVPQYSVYLLFVKHFIKHEYRPTEGASRVEFSRYFDDIFFSNIFSLNLQQTSLHSYRFYRLQQSYSCFFAIILSMILVLIRPITISWGKAEKVAFVQTTIVVTLLHLGREIEFSDCKDKASTYFPVFPFIFESHFPSNLLNSRNTVKLAQTSTFSLCVRE